jgi:CRP-like cAMP-binding protein
MWHAMQRERYFAHEQRSATDTAVALAALDATPLFVSVPTEVKEEMSRAAEIQLWDRGERIFEQGSAADACFIVSRGRLGVYVSEGDAEIHVAALQAGDLFGEMSLLTGGTRWATVRAEEDAELVRIDVSALNSALSRFPDLVQSLAETVAARRDELEEARQSLVRQTPDPSAATAPMRNVHDAAVRS